MLDVGCGLGFWGFLARTYATPRACIVGIDISVKKLRALKNLRIYDEVICADAYHLPFRAQVFNTILSIEVLHGLRNFNETLSDIERVAVGGALIVVAGPSNPIMLGGLMKGYDVYSSIFRGFVLINVGNGRGVTMWGSRWNSFLHLLASLYHRILGKRAAKYVLALKVL